MRRTIKFHLLTAPDDSTKLKVKDIKVIKLKAIKVIKVVNVKVMKVIYRPKKGCNTLQLSPGCYHGSGEGGRDKLTCEVPAQD